MNKKEIKRKIILYTVPKLVWYVIWILYFTCKNKFHIKDKLENKNVIVVFWHNELLMMPFLYRQIRKTPNIFVIISQHFDGLLIAKLCEYFKLNVINGSSSKGGVKVLIQAIKKIKENADVAITPDGPKGPMYSIADGVIAIAQKTGASIVIFRTECNKYWRLNTWDRLIIPKPFSQINYYSMRPFTIRKDLSINEAKEKLLNEMQQSLN